MIWTHAGGEGAIGAAYNQLRTLARAAESGNDDGGSPLTAPHRPAWIWL